jgi:hypothetical protein
MNAFQGVLIARQLNCFAVIAGNLPAGAAKAERSLVLGVGQLANCPGMLRALEVEAIDNGFRPEREAL